MPDGHGRPQPDPREEKERPLPTPEPSPTSEDSGPIPEPRYPIGVNPKKPCLKDGLAGDHVGMGGGTHGPWVQSDSGLPMKGEQHGEGSAFRGPPGPFRGEDVEDCVACRYIWLQVESEVGNVARPESVYDSFNRHCKVAISTHVFQPACMDMHAQADDMIGDYMDGYTINQLCENARLCR